MAKPVSWETWQKDLSFKRPGKAQRETKARPSRKYYENYVNTMRNAGPALQAQINKQHGFSGGGSGGSSGGHSGGGGGGSGGSGGSFRSAAKDQGKENFQAALKTAKLSNPNIFGPLGSQTVTWEDGQATVTQELTDDQQAILDLQERLRMQSGGLAGNLFDMVGTSRDEVTDAMLDRMRPELERQRERQQNQLMIQGHNRGGSAWNAIQDDIARRENDARLAAVLAGGQEQSRLIGAANALQSGSQPMIPTNQPYRGASVAPAPLFDAKVASAGHQIALGNQALTREQMAMQDALARDQMALQEQIARQNLGAYSDASRRQGLFDLAGLGIDAYNAFS